MLTDILARAAERPDALAVIDSRGRRTTFGQLAAEIARVAGQLRERGFEPGDAVLFAVRPDGGMLPLGLGVLAAGGVIVVADPGAGAGLAAARRQLLDQKLASVRWVAAESVLYALSARTSLRGKLKRAGLYLPDLEDRSLLRIRTGPWLPGAPLRPLPPRTGAPAQPALPGEQPGRDTPAVVVFTSGTTAEPRAVLHSLDSLHCGAQLLTGRIGAGPGDIVHTEQLMVALPFLAAGAAWSTSGVPVRPERVLRALRERGATHTFATAAAAETLLKAGPLPTSLRMFLLGAAPVPIPVLERLRDALPDTEIVAVYGATEALPIATATASEKLAYRDGDLLGTPLPGLSVRLDDTGEILVSGPNVAPAYLAEGEIRVLRTGDIGRIDPDGRLVLLGRAKDMIIRGSFNLYPRLYEDTVCRLPYIEAAAFVGLPDPVTLDEEVVLAVVPREGCPAGEAVARLRRELPELIDHAALPDRVVAIEAVPRTGRTEKPDRERLRELVRR
ncbi:MAG TPA: class I adenylate-forming enzyme family protein [Actinocrinis sp.]|nr:class I adenylate-forming enzyme family protein [Actinocrinis sp.]